MQKMEISMWAMVKSVSSRGGIQFLSVKAHFCICLFISSLLCTGSLMTDWTVWSGCNNSCGAGYRFKTRLCNLDTCYDSTREVESCIGDCLGKFFIIRFCPNF